MPSEKKKSVLKESKYKINGNLISAFYDKQHKLVFVLDSTISKFKPNVLLVIGSVGDRKWDDVLSNDYGMNLELVRPKKDNKYQKLDIEYDGLAFYDNLIRKYQDGENIKKALKDLENFRAASVRRSAQERLDAATIIVENAQETIDRTGDAIVELRAKIKAVRAKIASLRRNVGKEPTKQSAAKILKAEAQLDVLTGKLERAQKRLENANKRLLIAQDDMDAARQVLKLVPVPDDDVVDVRPVAAVSGKHARKQIVEEEPEEEQDDDDAKDDDKWIYDDDEDDEVESNDDLDEKDDQENTDDDDDETSESVKPLFDKDPNILDEKIAFKPISFDEKFDDTDKQNVTENISYDDEEDDDVLDVDEAEEEKNTQDMSFVPPRPIMDAISVPDDYNTKEEDEKLDSVFSEGVSDNIEYKQNEEKVKEPVLESMQPLEAPKTEEQPGGNTVDASQQFDEKAKIEEVEEVSPVVSQNVEPSGMPGAPEPQHRVIEENLVRPVSPIKQESAVVSAGESTQQTNPHRPNLLYYVLLLVLIGLSIFTLWLYQRSNVSGDVVPELVATDNLKDNKDTVPALDATVDKVTEQQVAVTTKNPEVDANPFVGNGVETEQKTGSVIEKIAQDSFDTIGVLADVKPASLDTPEEPVNNETPETKTVEQPITQEPEVSKDVVVTKPEYNVSYDGGNVAGTEIQTGAMLCEDGTSPDEHGCCSGEKYVDLGGETGHACCQDTEDGDCFPPMF